MGSRNGFGDGKVGRVGDPDEATGGVDRLLVQHFVSELQLGLFDIVSFGFLIIDRAGQSALEDILLRLWYRLEDLRRKAEVLCQDRFRGVGCMWSV